MGSLPVERLKSDQSAGEAIIGRPSRRRWLISLLAIALVAGVGARLFTRPEELTHLRRLSATVLLSAVLAQWVSQLVWNSATLLPLRTHVKNIGFWELFMLRTGGFLVGSIVPVAGNFALRMTYLRRRGLSYADFAWATILSNVMLLFSGTALAGLAVAVLWVVAGIPDPPVLLLTGAVLVIGVAALVVTGLLPRLGAHPLLRRWPWLAAISDFKASRRTMAWVLALSLIRHVFSFLAFGMLYQSLSPAPGGFLTGGLIYAITSPSRVVAITPGNNLGLNEWVVALVGKVLSVDLTTGLIVALAFRCVSLAAQALGVIIGATWLATWGAP